MGNIENYEPKVASTEVEVNKYKWIIDNSVDMISVHFPDGRYRYVSPSFTETLGYSSTDVLHLSPFDMIHEDELSIAKKNLERVLLGKKTAITSYRHRKKNGDYIWLEAKIKAIRDQNGKVLEVIAFTREIQEKVMYEKELLLTKQELHNVISNQQGIVLKIIKKDGNYQYTIFAGELIHALGWTQEDLIGKSPHDIFPRKNADYLVKHYNLAWYSKEKVTFEYHTINHLDLLVTIKPIVIEDQVVELIGSCTDITALKEAEKQLIQSEKLSIIGELSAGIAHEIRNPLTAIKGFLQLLKLEQKNKYIEIMETEVNRIEFITSEFMVLANPKSKKQRIFNISSVLEDVLFLIDMEAFKKRITINLQMEQEIQLKGEETQIKQVLLNMVKNAIEAMQEEGMININVLLQQQKVLIKISDQGCGIPEEKLDQIGKPFFTTKEKGNGLGLMISYKIIKEHGGTISVESEVNKGTTFIIELPACSSL